MIKSELNNGRSKTGVVHMPTAFTDVSFKSNRSIDFFQTSYSQNKIFVFTKITKSLGGGGGLREYVRNREQKFLVFL